MRGTRQIAELASGKQASNIKGVSRPSNHPTTNARKDKARLRVSVSPEEQSMFLEAIEGATPLAKRDRVPVFKPEPSVGVLVKKRLELPPTTKLTVEASSGDRFTARAAGVSRAQLAELSHGRIRPEATLDLHGHLAPAAERSLAEFLADAQRHLRRCVLIIHGQGLHSDGNSAILRDVVADALVGSLSGMVHACAAAMPKDGGAGATYVMVKAWGKP